MTGCAAAAAMSASENAIRKMVAKYIKSHAGSLDSVTTKDVRAYLSERFKIDITRE